MTQNQVEAILFIAGVLTAAVHADGKFGIEAEFTPGRIAEDAMRLSRWALESAKVDRVKHRGLALGIQLNADAILKPYAPITCECVNEGMILNIGERRLLVKVQP